MVSADKPDNRNFLPQIGTDEDFQHIEAAGGIKSPNQKFRRKLVRCIEYSARWEPDYPEVRDAELLKALRRLKAHAEPLLNDLTYPNYRGDDQRKRAQASAYGLALDFLGVGDALDHILRELVYQADLRLDVTAEDRGGRSPDARFEELIDCLTNLYEEFADQRARLSQNVGLYQGPFFHFVEACLERLAPSLPRRSNEALGKALQRHLKRRRQHYGMDKT